jgi:hypothetical protein
VFKYEHPTVMPAGRSASTTINMKVNIPPN